MSSPSSTLSELFVRGGWLPASDEDLKDWLRKLVEDTRSKPSLSSLSADTEKISSLVEDFRKFVKADSDMYMGFSRMLKGQKEIENLDEFLNLLKRVLQQAPSFGPFGPPVYMLLFRAMNTEAGFTTFLAEKLNKRLKELFNEWAKFLSSPASCHVLHDKEGGWFHKKALRATTKDFQEHSFQFSKIFVCDPKEEYWGYKSWDLYFNRKFQQGVRPVELPPPHEKSGDIIGGACESMLYKIGEDVKRSDMFWIKGEPYSLEHILQPNLYNNKIDGVEDVVKEFVGGTVFQGFLQVTGYHRWASPVAGTILKIVNVPGTYFVQSPALLNESDSNPNDPTDPKRHPFVRSLSFITSISARQLIFIKADNEKIGLMCFIAIGMTEISSCEATVKEKQQVKRGDELGMFHFGGSSHALLFRHKTNIQWVDDPKPGKLIKVRSAIGYVL